MAKKAQRAQISESYKDAPELYLASFTTKLLELSSVEAKLTTLYRQASVRALQARVLAEGFKPVTEGEKAFFGHANTYKSNDGKTATFEIIVHSYMKAGSKDQAAIASVKIKAGDKSDTYHFLLIAPNGDFEKVQEFTLGQNDAVVPANSYWDRFRACLADKCGSACLSAIPTCSGTWTAFLWCLIRKCGTCVLRCTACAACDCRWWCKWAAGCCD